MRRFLPRWWPATCLLLPLLTSGCQHSRSCCSTSDGPAAVAMGAPIAEPPPPAVGAGGPSEEGVSQAAPTNPPVIHTSAKPALPSATDPMLNLAPPATSSVPYARPDVEQLSPASYQDVPAAARTASRSDPRFYHDANYHWLVGTLDYSRIQEAWVLRYVPVEEDDRYGGCVTLVTPYRDGNFKRGQTVRVEGELIDPESQQLRPAFQVRNLRALEP